MLVELVEKLDVWVVQRNLEARAEGLPALAPCILRLLGQSALFEMRAPLTLAVTNDVDLYANYSYAIEVELRRLLKSVGKDLDAFGHEIWMPKETKYERVYSGEYVSLEIADMESILLSKALKAPRKNRALIVEYLAQGASPRFLHLAGKYALDLEAFV